MRHDFMIVDQGITPSDSSSSSVRSSPSSGMSSESTILCSYVNILVMANPLYSEYFGINSLNFVMNSCLFKLPKNLAKKELYVSEN